jgi:hypothetical protein
MYRFGLQTWIFGSHTTSRHHSSSLKCAQGLKRNGHGNVGANTPRTLSISPVSEVERRGATCSTRSSAI